MRRQKNEARFMWESKVEKRGLMYHTVINPEGKKEPYWTENAHYTFSMEEILKIESVTNEIWEMLVKVGEKIITEGWITSRLHLPESAVPLITNSWENDDWSIYGRLDFSYNPLIDPNPKLLEFNGDTPTGLLEASVIQWDWFENYKDKHNLPNADQFNSIHESLVHGWTRMRDFNRLHFGVLTEMVEDYQTVLYLADTAKEAGKATKIMHMNVIGYNKEREVFTNDDEETIEALFKLYPWENMFGEEFAEFLGKGPTMWLEPFWKILLANKAILPILWEMFPDHPNLLPASDTIDLVKSSYAKKALYSREGANVTLSHEGMDFSTGGNYLNGPFIYQKYFPLPNFDGRYPVIGSWLINGEAHGMGIRESASPITTNHSQFIPHLIEN
jgi:glutathionylspermidine synthase